MLPARIRKAKADTGRPQRDRCPSHLNFVRSHACCVPGCPGMPIEAAHVRVGNVAGVGLKPGDQHTISLCRDHHAESHRIGERSFASKYGIDLHALSREFAAASPAWRRYMMKKDAAL